MHARFRLTTAIMGLSLLAACGAADQSTFVRDKIKHIIIMILL